MDALAPDPPLTPFVLPRMRGAPTNCFSGLEVRMAFELAEEDPLGD